MSLTVPITERYPEMLLLMAGAAMLTMGCQHAAAPERMVASSPEVTVAKPERRVLTLSTTQPGRIEAFEQTPLFAKVAGYVEEVRIDIGDVVQKNEVLVRLAVPELLDELQANVETAELVHTFDGSFDTTATIEMNLFNATEYFPHQWQLRYLGWDVSLDSWGQPDPETTNEEGIFNLHSFSGRWDTPATFVESSSVCLPLPYARVHLASSWCD